VVPLYAAEMDAFIVLTTQVDFSSEHEDLGQFGDSASGVYTAKSAYNALFEGAVSFAPFEGI
jgi:hypothetical protein